MFYKVFFTQVLVLTTTVAKPREKIHPTYGKPSFKIRQRDPMKILPQEDQQSDHSEEKIYYADSGTIPWEKYLVQIVDGESHKCSGVRINNAEILSAAHCFFNNTRLQKHGADRNCGCRDDLNFEVRIRENKGWKNLGITNVCKGRKFYKNELRPLSESDPDSVIITQEDVAIVTIDDNEGNNFPIESLPTCESTSNIRAVGHVCTVLGMGITENDKFPNKPLHKNVTIQDLQKCTGARIDRLLRARLTCTDPAAMMGDSGGPFICETPGGKACLAGVVSGKMEEQNTRKLTGTLISVVKQCNINKLLCDIHECPENDHARDCVSRIRKCH